MSDPGSQVHVSHAGSARDLTAVGHLGWDVITDHGLASRHLGGSLFHFLNGLAFACVPCRAVTWTTSELATRAAEALPPWISVSNWPVDVSPTFDIDYNGETLTRFDITGIAMPPAVPAGLGRVNDMHFCAMPLTDVVAILAQAQPTRWSMQFHSAVISHSSDLERLSVQPGLAFCTSSEFGLLAPVVSALTSSTWIVTDRDRVRALRNGVILTEFVFPAYESVVDATGAGDLLAGSLIGSLRRGVPLPLAIRFACGVVATSLSEHSSDALRGWWRAASQSLPSSGLSPS